MDPGMSSCQFRIRLASADDCEAIHHFIKQLSEDVKMAPGSLQTTAQGLRRDKDYFECLFAEARIPGTAADHPVTWKPVGCVIYLFAFSVYFGRQLNVILVYTDPHYRGKGIGRALMKTVAETATANGIRQVMWTTAESNKSAISFYKSFGATSTPRHRFTLMSEALTLLTEEPEDARFWRENDPICIKNTQPINHTLNGTRCNAHVETDRKRNDRKEVHTKPDENNNILFARK
ncbi:thialysine N-epsilon-acetyltransferase isoform X2 [Nematostella vectensis]|uniref:thialysine N-epsilon-acetyltransferase isoform X2 n=1 Tax=Nematostella vectensis TaxID=45351 RepID=UPI0020770EE0|nr:thialysine N-epsilon-acetyltransferase isoform X2 [Nematostella vectensis]